MAGLAGYSSYIVTTTQEVPEHVAAEKLVSQRLAVSIAEEKDLDSNYYSERTEVLDSVEYAALARIQSCLKMV